MRCRHLHDHDLLRLYCWDFLQTNISIRHQLDTSTAIYLSKFLLLASCPIAGCPVAVPWHGSLESAALCCTQVLAQVRLCILVSQALYVIKIWGTGICILLLVFYPQPPWVFNKLTVRDWILLCQAIISLILCGLSSAGTKASEHSWIEV